MIDFDALNAEDPNQVSEYVAETFQYYKDREVRSRRISAVQMSACFLS